jgi:flagellar basal body-associated protein FliL
MAEEEASAPEGNAEATEAAEAGTEAAAEAPAEAAPPQSLWMPMILSSVISIVGVVVLFMFVIKPGIKTAIDDALKDANGTPVAKNDDGQGGEEEKDGHGGDEEPDKKGVDDSAGEIPIVEDGDNIVINPAGSNGTRYLLVEIFLTREKDSDTGFRKAIEDHTKMLKKITMDKLASLDVQQCTDPSIRPRIMYQLKRAYQEVLGSKHPIDELILATWVMQ